jgi:AcrR family transcriptional regulator
MAPPRRQRERLTRDRILSAALRLLDREGLEAISMRRIGDELGVEAMSLYNHVASKAEILDGIFESILNELPPAPRAKSWSLALRDRASALRMALEKHPNALSLFATRSAVTPASMAHLEAALAVLHSAGFGPDDAITAVHVVVAFVVGHTLGSVPMENASSPDYDALDHARFPRVVAAARLLPTHDFEKEFHVGLEATLLGLESVRGKNRRGAPARRGGARQNASRAQKASLNLKNRPH